MKIPKIKINNILSRFFYLLLPPMASLERRSQSAVPMSNLTTNLKHCTCRKIQRLRTSSKHIWIDERISAVSSPKAIYDVDLSPSNLDFLSTTNDDMIDDPECWYFLMTIGWIPQVHRIYRCNTLLGSIPSIVFISTGKALYGKDSW
jgi:hypothetical protein